MASKPNIVLFGEPGAGKSSLINMLSGFDVAAVSSDSNGTTFENTPYEIECDGLTCQIFDTVGLGEGNGGRVSTTDAIIGLYQLAKNLDGGLNLLVFCTRRSPSGGEVSKLDADNYKMFYSTLCRKQVPIIIVALGLEQMEQDMNFWWQTHQVEFQSRDMGFSNHVCGTAVMGRGNCFESRYNDTKAALQAAIKTSYRPEPWKIVPAKWYETAGKKLWNKIRIFGRKPHQRELADALVMRGVPRPEAIKIANNVTG